MVKRLMAYDDIVTPHTNHQEEGPRARPTRFAPAVSEVSAFRLALRPVGSVARLLWGQRPSRRVGHALTVKSFIPYVQD